DHKMDMRCPAGVGDRPDRQESVRAVGIRNGLAETLEIRVARPAGIAVAHIVIAAIGVALPDLDARPRYRPSGEIENASRDLRRRALCRFGMPRDMQEIAV